ncbi:MAG: hypothetical protein HN350_18205 [Phycisphaerales bacterium]|jgi:chemotaxis signal transduction protein|nr:hypothetical protein [Phycisphaerales bacterium]
MNQFATFRLNDQLFGVNVLLVREINQQTDFTPVQHAPDYVRGLIIRRTIGVRIPNRFMCPTTLLSARPTST